MLKNNVRLSLSALNPLDIENRDFFRPITYCNYSYKQDYIGILAWKTSFVLSVVRKKKKANNRGGAGGQSDKEELIETIKRKKRADEKTLRKRFPSWDFSCEA